MPSQMIELSKDKSGTYKAYTGVPATKPKGGILVVQEIYGVNPEVRRLVDRFTQLGYLTMAPDLMWRHGELKEFAYDDRDGARGLLEKVNMTDLNNDLVHAIGALHQKLGSNELKVGTLALGWGGKPAIQASSQGQVDALVTFYPGTLNGAFDVVPAFKKSMQIHFALDDFRTPPDFRKKLRQSITNRDDVEIFVYPGVDHGFANQGRTEFNRGVAERADARCEQFFALNVG